MRHRKPEDFIEFPIQPDPIDLVHVLPILQRDHEVEALLDSNAANAENLRHINNANAAHFHVITSQFGRCRHELAAFERSDPGHVVGHEAVTALDQPQDAFALADSARTADQNAHTQDVHHAAELRYRRGKIHL